MDTLLVRSVLGVSVTFTCYTTTNPTRMFLRAPAGQVQCMVGCFQFLHVLYQQNCSTHPFESRVPWHIHGECSVPHVMDHFRCFLVCLSSMDCNATCLITEDDQPPTLEEDLPPVMSAAEGKHHRLLSMVGLLSISSPPTSRLVPVDHPAYRRGRRGQAHTSGDAQQGAQEPASCSTAANVYLRGRPPGSLTVLYHPQCTGWRNVV